MSTPLAHAARRFLFALALAGPLAGARLAGAEGPAGPPDVAGYLREQARQGLEHFKAGRWSQARYHLREALTVKETAGLHYYMGVCEARLGALREAHRHLQQAMVIASTPGASTESAATRRTVLAEAERERNEVEDRFAKLWLHWVTEPPPSVTVLLDDETLDVAKRSGVEQMWLDAGEHHLVASAAGHRPLTVDFRLDESQQLTLDLRLEPAATSAPAPPPPRAPASSSKRTPPSAGWQRPLGYVGLGLGAALVGAGVYASFRGGPTEEYVLGGAGIAVAGVGAYFAFFAPAPDQVAPARASWQLVPSLSPTQAGLGVRWAF